MTHLLALKTAIECAGGQSALAKQISEQMPSIPPLRHQNVQKWFYSSFVPALYCPSIERLTGVRCEDLCPHPDWGYMRGKSKRPALGKRRG